MNHTIIKRSESFFPYHTSNRVKMKKTDINEKKRCLSVKDVS